MNTFWAAPRAVHMMGIGGVGMAGLARVLAARGHCVSGCDSAPNILTEWLVQNGIPVSNGHAPDHIADSTRVLIVTPAVHDDNPELLAARARHLPVYRRGEVLALFTSSAAQSIAVCGTHGKTTTSCFATRILQELNDNPGWCIGGSTKTLATVARAPNGKEPFVVEADESDGTLALYHPTVTILNNLDIDHLEHFKGVDDLHDCFRTVLRQTKNTVVACRDHSVAWQLAHDTIAEQRAAVPAKKITLISFGFSAKATLRATDVWCDARGAAFTIHWRGNQRRVTLPVTGNHNVLNALGAAGSALALGHTFEQVCAALPRACAELPGRRFELLRVYHGSIRFIADYAHHPAEIARAIEMARIFKPKRLRVIFQPHRYTRTLALGDLFPEAFAGVDELILLPVYAASEMPLPGGDVCDLYAKIRARCTMTLSLARSVTEAWPYICTTMKDGDTILIVGAGDVIQLGMMAKYAVPSSWTLRYDDKLPPVPPLRLSFYGTGGARAPTIIQLPTDIPELKTSRENNLKTSMLKPRIIGMGSNSWFSDLDLAPILLAPAPPCTRQSILCLPRDTHNHADIEVSAGVKGGVLLDYLEKAGLSGLEFMDSIPGTVGGWLAMNAGAHGGAFGDCVAWIRRLSSDGNVDVISGAACGFNYRMCDAVRDHIALACGLTLTHSTPDAIHAARLAFRAKRIPLEGLRTCGSVFRNPKNASAGKLLDEAGCKGLQIGGAKVADFHANIIIAQEDATSSDILALAWMMRNRVREKTGITLIPEISGLEF